MSRRALLAACAFASHLTLFAIGCLPPRLDFGTRPADPHTTHLRVREGDRVLRGGIVTDGEAGPFLEQAGADGRVAWERDFAPVGEARLRIVQAAVGRSGGGAIVLIGDERAPAIAFASLSVDGAGTSATELALDGLALGPRALVAGRSAGGAFASVRLVAAADPRAPGEALVVRVGEGATIEHATRLSGIHSVHAMAPANDGAVVVAGVGGVDPSDQALVVAAVAADGALPLARRLDARGLRAGSAMASADVTPSGAVLVAFVLKGEDGDDVAVVRLASDGSLRWARRIRRTRVDQLRTAHGQRPFGPRLHVVGAHDERAHVVLTDPVLAPGRYTRLVHVELDETGMVLAQRAVPTTTEKPLRLEPIADGMRAVLEDMPPCTFPAAGPARCGGPEASAALTVEEIPASAFPWPIEGRREPISPHTVPLRPSARAR